MFFRYYKIRIVLGIITLFLVSLVMSCQELHYAISSKTITATLADNHLEKEEHNGQTYQKRVVGYFWMDNDTYRREYADVPIDWPGLNSPTVKIQYIPGKERQSRLYGSTNLGWTYLFFASLIAAAIWLFFAVRESTPKPRH